MTDTTTPPTTAERAVGMLDPQQLTPELVFEFDIDEPFVPDMSRAAQRQFRAALAKAQKEYGPVLRDRTVWVRMKDGGEYSFNYAELSNVIDATLSLSENGISVSQPVHQDRDGKTWLYTILAHDGGGGQVTRLRLMGGEDLKQFGGEITYLRRYCLGPAIGVASEPDADDHGDGGDEAPGRNKKPPPKSEEEGQQATTPRRPPPPPAKPKPAQTWPETNFEQNLKGWEEMLLSGRKTLDELLAMVRNRFSLTEEQEKKLRALVPQK